MCVLGTRAVAVTASLPRVSCISTHCQVNEHFAELSGFSRDEVLGHNCRFLQGPRSDAKTLLAIREAVQRGEGIMVKLLNYKKDRTVFWNLLCIVPDPSSRLGPRELFSGPKKYSLLQIPMETIACALITLRGPNHERRPRSPTGKGGSVASSAARSTSRPTVRGLSGRLSTLRAFHSK